MRHSRLVSGSHQWGISHCILWICRRKCGGYLYGPTGWNRYPTHYGRIGRKSQSHLVTGWKIYCFFLQSFGKERNFHYFQRLHPFVAQWETLPPFDEFAGRKSLSGVVLEVIISTLFLALRRRIRYSILLWLILDKNCGYYR